MSNNIIMEINLPTIQFSVKTLQSLHAKALLDEEKAIKAKSNSDTNEIVDKVIKQLNIKKKSKDVDDTLTFEEKYIIYEPVFNYIRLHYFETEKGAYYLYNVKDKEFQYRENGDFKKEVLVKLKDVFVNDVIEKNEKIFHITAQLKRPRLFIENNIYYINECKGFLHKNPRPYNKFSKTIQDGVQLMLDFFLEVYCNNDKAIYECYLNYLSQLCKGEKTEVIIYMKSHQQGIGKSTGTDFIFNHVLGNDICLISGTEPLLKDFNKIFLGKLLILFEELPTFSTAQWEAVSSKLKTMTTEKQTVYRGLFKEPIQAENISNFYINTNVESLKDSQGRRIIIMPLNASRLGDFEYFETLRSKCFNNDVGEAFFSLMLSRDTSKFYAQRDFPEMTNKTIAISNQLHPVFKFIKEQYYLKKVGIDKVSPIELHKVYETYCNANNLKALSKILFMNKLEEINIKFMKTNGNNVYKVSYKELDDIATKYKWVCIYDEFDNINDDDDDEEDDDLDAESEKKAKLNIIWKQKYIELEKETKRLRKLLSIKEDEDI
jgi:hypothetical protein